MTTTKTQWTRAELAQAVVAHDDLTVAQKDKLIQHIGTTAQWRLDNAQELAERIDFIAKTMDLCADGVEDFKRSIGLTLPKPNKTQTVTLTVVVEVECIGADNPSAQHARNKAVAALRGTTLVVPNKATGADGVKIVSAS